MPQALRPKTSSETKSEDYVVLPAKSRLCKECGEGYWCKWFLDVDGVLVPWSVLEKTGIVMDVGNKKYVPREIASKMKLFVFENIGSRKRPRWALRKIIDTNGNVVEEITNEEEAEKLGEKYLTETYSVWKTALEKVSPPTIVFKEPSIRSSEWGNELKVYVQNDYITIGIKKTPRYTVINLPYAPAKTLEPIVNKIIEQTALKHGFRPGKYGGYITYSKISREEIKKIAEEIKQELMKHKEEFEKLIKEKEELRYRDKKKQVEEVRKKLGIYKPAEEPITREDILRLVRPEETREEELGEVGDLEEILAEWGLEEVGVPPIKLEKKEEKTEEEKEEEELKRVEEKIRRKYEKITPEKLAEQMIRHGFTNVKLIVFDLPSEYKGAETTYEKIGGKVVEKRSFKIDPRIYRTLRKQFYNVLNKIAYRTPMGWIMLKNPDKKYLNELNKIIKEFEKISGEKRPIWIYEAYLPREPVVEWLKENIALKKANIEEIKQKLVSEELKQHQLRKYQKKLNELIEYVEQLEKELKHLT